MCIKNLFIAGFLFFYALVIPALAQNRIQIESDSLKYYGGKNLSVFKGNVVVNSDNMTVHSDNMTVFFNDSQEVERIFAEGSVNITRNEMYAISKKAEMLVNSNIIKLSNDVRVWQGENYLEGEEVIIYNDEDRIEVKKSGEGRVKIIFYPDKKGKGIVDKGGKPEEDIQKENGSK